jgi:hypothetical protein
VVKKATDQPLIYEVHRVMTDCLGQVKKVAPSTSTTSTIIRPRVAVPPSRVIPLPHTSFDRTTPQCDRPLIYTMGHEDAHIIRIEHQNSSIYLNHRLVNV